MSTRFNKVSITYSVHPTIELLFLNHFMEFYLRAWQNYANFSGRDTRQQFWMFAAFNFAISLIISFIGLQDTIGGLYSLAVLLPSLAIGARRLHDTDKSGWWQLLLFIPIVGWIILIVFFATKGETVANHYGESPYQANPVQPAIK